MKGKIVRKNYTTKADIHFGNLGEYAFTYNGIDYHVGDIVFIIDSFFIKRTTLVVKVEQGYYVYGYPGTLNGFIHKCDILKLRIIKKYTELENNNYIDGFTIKIDNSDVENLLKNTSAQIKEMLTVKDKLSLVELSINSLLSNFNNLSTSEKIKLHELGKKYSILYEILKDQEDMKIVNKFKREATK
ncbi:hypothetical protein [Clostridium sp.]|jgi:hypothetical protein|uniref:hypothetical protein n=1 Tax=Clostridium sp. TaxID=1506 RepID=UPI00258A9EB3|nr:hypothetical protein [Clostridium sp.]MDF2503807.1 hypothetical protein [Clostridium sp.]